MWRRSPLVLFQPLLLSKITLPTVIIFQVLGSSFCDLDSLDRSKVILNFFCLSVSKGSRIVKPTVIKPSRFVESLWTSGWPFVFLDSFSFEVADPLKLSYEKLTFESIRFFFSAIDWCFIFSSAFLTWDEEPSLLLLSPSFNKDGSLKSSAVYFFPIFFETFLDSHPS